MKRTIDLGKCKYSNFKTKIAKASVTIELRDTAKGPELSICGDICNGRTGTLYTGGQCLDEIAKYIKTPLFKEIHRLWKAYHLNAMHAGTEAQENEINSWLEAEHYDYDYDLVCEHLKAYDLYEDSAYLVDGKPYRYGTGWLYRAIPEKDLLIIKKIIEEGTL